MKKSLITVLSIVGVIGLLLIWMVSTYNKLVTLDEAVTAQWAQVESAYKRRVDLIPNLVATVKGYAGHESSTYENVTAARAKATQVTLDLSDISEEKLKEFQAAQGELSVALGRLMMIQENYPELKANQNFLDLQAQLEGTENRINTERVRYNNSCRGFNSSIRRFPGMLFGFEKRLYFEISTEDMETPEVQF
ncbi:MAG TPA: LemA family protein [Bacteroidaceae bacterium]|nr:LemA family protein [Bacteroidaceae bacterium]